VSARQKAKALTLNEYADKWIGQRNVKPGTKIEYKRLKARLIKDTIGKVPLRNLHPHIGARSCSGNYRSIATLSACRRTSLAVVE